MSPTELERYHHLYELHLTNLALQGKRPATIEAYSRGASLNLTAIAYNFLSLHFK